LHNPVDRQTVKGENNHHGTAINNNKTENRCTVTKITLILYLERTAMNQIINK